MEHKLKQYNTLKTITLTENERNMLRAHAHHLMTTTASPVVESLFHRGVTHGLRIALSSFLFVLFAGGSVSAVASSALPGDPLYSFKVNVNEQVKGFFLNTSEEKVAWQKGRIENRLSEIKTLAETKTLTKAKQATLQKALDNHVNEITKELDTLSENAPSTALSVSATLEESLRANQDILLATDESLTQNSGTEAALLTVSDAIKKVSDQEVQIISREINSLTDQLTVQVPDTTTSGTTSTPIETPPPSTTPSTP